MKTTLRILSAGSIILLLTVFLSSCDKDEEFKFELDDLLETQWGIPQIVEPGTVDFIVDAPTIFYGDGHMRIGHHTDFWTLRDSRSLFIQEASQVWFIIELKPERLYVEKSSYPDGAFIVKCFYEPLPE